MLFYDPGTKSVSIFEWIKKKKSKEQCFMRREIKFQPQRLKFCLLTAHTVFLCGPWLLSRCDRGVTVVMEPSGPKPSSLYCFRALCGTAWWPYPGDTPGSGYRPGSNVQPAACRLPVLLMMPVLPVLPHAP